MTGLRSVSYGFKDFVDVATDPTPRVGFGLPFLDNRMNGGMGKSEIAMIMAGSSVGKTTIALNAIANNPTVPVLFFSLEMSWRQVCARIAAITTPTSTKSLERETRARGGPPDALTKTTNAFPLLLGDDTPGITFKQMTESMKKAEDMNGGHKVRYVIVDYLELMGGSGLLTKSEAVDKASQKIRDWTREHDVSTIVLHQVGKSDPDAGSGPLALTSGKFGGYAPMDVVIGAYAPRLQRGLDRSVSEELREDLYLQLLKNRTTGEEHHNGVRHRLDRESMRITDLTQYHRPPSGWHEQELLGAA